MLKFDKQKLIGNLERLSRELRVVFAATCAERQLPAYKVFVNQSGFGDSDALIRILDDVWANPGKEEDGEREQQQLQQCLALIPREDVITPWTEEASYAQDAGISVAHTLRARITGKAEEAAWSAQVAYESLDNFVINRERIDTNVVGGEDRVLSHPLVQAELTRQERDIKELLRASPDLMQVRARAKIESAVFFMEK